MSWWERTTPSTRALLVAGGVVVVAAKVAVPVLVTRGHGSSDPAPIRSPNGPGAV